MKEEIRRKINEELNIPPFPEAALRVQSLVEDPAVTARDLAAVISADSGLTATVLKHANSSFYGFPKTIGTIPLAVVVLGLDSVREIAVGVTSVNVANSIFQQDIFDAQRFWSHSLAVACAGRIVAHKWRLALPGEAFVSGLLHDIGRLLLASIAPDDYRKAMGMLVSKERTSFEVEQEVFGVDHAQVAGMLLEFWNFPIKLIDAVARHHSEDNFTENGLTQSVIVGDLLAHRSGFRHQAAGISMKILPSHLMNLEGFKENEIIPEMKESHRKAQAIIQSLNR